jgi:predicted dehydrogenase
VRNLPGRLLQNIISHGIAKIAEYFPGDDPEVMSCAFASKRLLDAGETDIMDELRVVISDRASAVTAYFTFSTQARPHLHQFRVYGPRNGLLTDDDQLVFLKLRGRRYKSYLEQFVPPFTYAGQYAANGLENIRRFLTRELHNDLGLKNLLAAFYSSIASKEAPPIAYREILLTTRIMEKIFAQVFPRTQGD